MSKQHPKEFGFQNGLNIEVSGHGNLKFKELTPLARTVKDVVYVAILEPGGECLKVGISEGNLLIRWRATCKTFDKLPGVRESLRKHETAYGESIVSFAKNKTIQVWFKSSERNKLSYVDRYVSMRSGEEDFLDDYYEPCMGRKLSLRKQRVAKIPRARRLRDAGIKS